MEHSHIKIPFAFFAHDLANGRRATGTCLRPHAATLCIGIGVYPEALYQLLPNYALMLQRVGLTMRTM